MVARLLRSSGGTAGVSYFGIRPIKDHIVLRGNSEEAPSVVVKGVVVLCTTEPIKFQDVSLRLTGESKTSFSYLTAAGSMRLMRQESEFLKHKWQFDVSNPNPKQENVIPAGNHEWPFSVILPGDLPESVEGHTSSWIIYRLKAVIDRGLFAKNVEARRHIRLIRTFDPTSPDLLQDSSLTNSWPNKIDYHISTSMKCVAVGSAVTVDFQLNPLLKGLRIGRIKTAVEETVALTVDTKGEASRTLRTTRNVAIDEYELPEDGEPHEALVTSRSIQLPRNLRHCLQSVHEKNIHVTHQLKFNIALHNPDGHLSELRASLPIFVYIAPHLRLNDQNEVDPSLPIVATAFEYVAGAPPVYGDHSFDPLYTELDSRAYITPGQSQPQSRRGSDGEVDTEIGDTDADRELAANTLRNRLADLQGANLAQEVIGNAEAISRIPSYDTAVHASTPLTLTPGLPNYNEATHAPPTSNGHDAPPHLTPAV